MQKSTSYYFSILVLSLLLGGSNAFSQAPNANEEILSKIHSAYIYHLTKYFIWPPQNINQSQFIIGVLGHEQTAISRELRTMSKTKNANGLPIVIKQFDSPADISADCHIVYIPYENSNYLSEILMKTQRKPILVVTAKEGLGRVGSPVNLITVDGKTSFELNLDAIEKRALKFAQQLRGIAILI